jgi:hypothetical protein
MASLHTLTRTVKGLFGPTPVAASGCNRAGAGAAALLAGALCWSSAAQAQNSLHIPRAATPPVLADYIDGVPAQHGVEVKDFRQYQPNDGTPASQDTRAYLSFDDTHLYAVFVAKVDPKRVRAQMTKRENIMGDDEVMLEIDTFHDKQRSFVFHANPYGIQFDGKRTEGIGLDFNFDTQWQSDGQLTKDGFVTMMAIPFKSLRFTSADVQTWGIAVGRIVGGSNEWSFWPTISQKSAAFVPQMADMTIPAKLVAGRNFQLNPSFYTGSSKYLDSSKAAAPSWQENKKSRPGLDAKWVVGESVAVDLTLNPDFSEVESDEPQALVNQRYEVLFPEKRPFFLENASFFQTPQSMFFSRRIIEPKAGARVTGREGGWSFGGLLIDDVAPGKMLASTSADYGKKSTIAVARVQNDFTQGSNAGALFTQRHLGNTSNSVASGDVRYQFDDNWYLSGQLAHSQTKDGNAARDAGNLAYLELKRTGRNFVYSGKYLDIGAQFDTTLAFLPRTDVRQTTQLLRYMWDLPATTGLIQAGPQFKGVVSRDHNRLVQDWSAESTLLLRTQYSSDVNFVNLNSYENFLGKGFQKHGVGVSVSSDLLDWLGVQVITGADDTINYAPAKGLDSSLGNARDFSLNLALKPSSQWRIDQTVLYNHLYSKTAMAGQAADSMIYRDLVWRTKLAYQYNRFMGVRLVLDYHDLKANPMLSGLKSGKQLNKDLQLSYVVGPGTTLYAGYADRQENLALIGNPQRVVDTDKLDLTTGRSVFLKLNYLFQL